MRGMRFLLLGLACLVAIAAAPSAMAATKPPRGGTVSAFLFGSQTVQPTADSNAAGSAQAFQVTNSTPGTANSITVYLSSNDAATTLWAGLYTDNNGQPGNLLASGSIASPQAGAWDTVSITPTSVSAGNYWVALLGTGSALYFQDAQSGTCNTQTSASDNLSSLPSSWTTGGIWNNAYCPVSAYVGGSAGGTTTTTPTGTTTTPTGTTTIPTGTTTTPAESPVNTALPVLSGTATQGQTLTVSNGSWSNNPTRYSYAWQRCGQGMCGAVSGATASSYTLQAADVGETIEAIVTATNDGGSAAATTAPSATVAGNGPATDDAVLFGSQTVGPAVDSNPAGSAQAFAVTSSTGGTADSVKIYVGPSDAASTVSAGIYADDAGQPGALVGSGSLASPQAGAWDTVPISPTTISAGKYWIAVLSTGSPLYFQDATSGTCDTQVTASSNLTSLPSSWTTGATWTNQFCPLSAYVTGTVAGATTTPPPTTPQTTPTQTTTTPTQTTTTPTQTTTTPAQTTTTPTQTAPAGLPTGVITQPIDGGSNYYCANGFTNACNGGWDNPAFVPIVDDYAFYSGNSTSSFNSLGLNSDVRVSGGTNMSTLRAANIWTIAAADAATNFGSETVGAHVEEPSTWSDITSQASDLGGLFGLSGRFIQASFTWNQIYYGNISGSACGGGGTMSMQEIMTCTTGMPDGRHLDIATDDIYWFAGQNVGSYAQYYCGLIYKQGGNCTAAQTAEASHYGDMVDTMREWLNGGSDSGASGTAPNAPYIETDDGLVGAGSQPIKPNELNWAVWDTFVHGARMIFYFGNTSANGTGNNGQFGFSDQVQSGQTVSDATQATHTNTLVENLAPIINSPFAVGFASTGNGGYTFPTPDQLLGTGSQLDIMAKYYSGSGFSNSSGTFAPGFYIFATPRGQETGTNIPVTFTIKGNYSGTVPYICACSPTQSTGTVSVSNHQFTDTFAKATDVHIYGPFPNQ